MLRNLGDRGLHCLLHLVNESFRQGRLATEWHKAMLFPLPKPGKDHSDTKSYRPISLLATMSKITERMIYFRLYRHVEQKCFLPEEQAGFRTKRTTMDNLIRLTQTIHQGFMKKEPTTALFLDVSKAFDTVPENMMKFKLFDNFGLRGNMLRWLSDFLHHRLYSTKVGSEHSDYEEFRDGVPQGSVLSPLLFALYLADASPQVRGVYFSFFADDMALWSTSRNRRGDQLLRLQKALDELSEWASKWRMIFSPLKSQCILFTYQYATPTWYPANGTQSPFTFFGNKIPYDHHPKLLGLCFDRKLSWSYHIENIVKSGNRKLNLIRRITACTWGADRFVLEKLLNQFLRPTLEYGSIIWGSAQPSLLHRVDKVYHRGLEAVLGAKKGTPIPILHAELNARTLHQRREKFLARKLRKILASPDTHILAKSHKYWQDHRLAIDNNPKQKHFYWRASLAYQKVFSINPESLPRKTKPVPIQPAWSNEPEPDEAEAIAQSQIEQELRRLSETRARAESDKDYQNSRKGAHYKALRPNLIKKWPKVKLKTRRKTTTLFRLRSGHNLLGAHNKCIKGPDQVHPGQAPDPEYYCPHHILQDVPDTAMHLLMECQHYTAQRLKLMRYAHVFSGKQNEITMQILLGSTPEIQERDQKIIYEAVTNFVLEARGHL